MELTYRLPRCGGSNNGTQPVWERGASLSGPWHMIENKRYSMDVSNL